MKETIASRLRDEPVYGMLSRICRHFDMLSLRNSSGADIHQIENLNATISANQRTLKRESGIETTLGALEAENPDAYRKHLANVGEAIL